MSEESKPITHDEIIQKDLLLPDIEQARILIKEYENLEAALKKIMIASGKKFNSIDPKTISDTREMAVEQKKVEASIKGITEIQKQKLIQDEKTRILNAQAKKDIKEIARDQLGLTTEYQKQSRELNNLREKYQELALAGKGQTTVAKGLLQVINEQDEKLKSLDSTVGKHHRTIGDYAIALKGLNGILLAAGEALGFDKEAIEKLHESHKILKEGLHSIHELLHKSGLAHHAEAEAVTAEAEAEVAANKAKTLSLPIIGLVIAGIAALGTAIYLYIQKLKDEEEQESARSRAMDGTIIKNEELRKKYDEHIIKVIELANSYKVLNGEMTQFEAEMSNISARTTAKAMDQMNKSNKEIQEASKRGFMDYLRNAAYYTGGIFYGMDSGEDKRKERMKEKLEERNKMIGAITQEGIDELKQKKFEEDKKASEDAKKEKEKKLKDSEDKNKKELEIIKKHIAEMNKIQADAVVYDQKLMDEMEADKDKKIKDDMDRYLSERNGVVETEIEQEKIKIAKLKELRLQEIEDAYQTAKAIEAGVKKGLENRNALEQKFYENQATYANAQIQEQAALAKSGQANMLDAKLRDLAKAQDEELKLKRKAQREEKGLQLASIFLEEMKVYAKDGPAAAGKALSATLFSEAVSQGFTAIFAEQGGLITKDGKNKTSLLPGGKRHKSGKDVVALLEEDERVLSVNQNKIFESLGGLDMLKNPAEYMKTIIINDHSEVVSELREIKEALANQPAIIYHKDENGNDIKTIKQNGQITNFVKIKSEIIPSRVN